MIKTRNLNKLNGRTQEPNGQPVKNKSININMKKETEEREQQILQH